MRIRILSLLPALVLTLAWVGSASIAHAQERVRIPQESLVDLTDLEQVIATGKRFEQERRWGEALMHYEQAVRNYPDRHELGERLLTARMYYDVGRRYHDRSFISTIEQLEEAKALDLYGEILLKIHSHYVDDPNWTQIVRRGGQAIEIALNEPSFRQYHRLAAKPIRQANSESHDGDSATNSATRLAAFVSEVQRMRTIHTRHEAREMVKYFAQIGHRQLRLSSAAIVLEFASAATGTLDNYSTFLTGDQLNDVMSQIEGNFVGLGIELKADGDGLLIVHVIAGGPAQLDGLAVGERIIGIDGLPTTRGSLDAAADMLKGIEGSTVKLTIQSRLGQPRNTQLRRQRVEVPSIEDVGIVDHEFGIAYVRLSSFQKTTGRDFESALWDLHRQGMRSIIVDVRGNPGGLLTASVEVADKFVSSGSIVRTKGRSLAENHDYRAQAIGTWRVPLIVLLDGDSASASEIFAGAIHDHRRGTLIGKRSYGKGSVQGIFPLHVTTAGVRLTTAKFYSPSGQSITNRGVEPDIVVQSTAKPVGRNGVGGNRSSSEDAILNAGLQFARRQFTHR
jgi:carboxyl-terminal processing protease